MNRNKLLAKAGLEILAIMAIGLEAIDDSCGAVVVAVHDDGSFHVFINGGLLPDGADTKRFEGPVGMVNAYAFAQTIVAEMIADQVAVWA